MAPIITAGDGSVFISGDQNSTEKGLYIAEPSTHTLRQILPTGHMFDVIYNTEFGSFIGSTTSIRHNGIFRWFNGELTCVWPHDYQWNHFEEVNGTLYAYSKHAIGALIFNRKEQRFEPGVDYYGRDERFGDYWVSRSLSNNTSISRGHKNSIGLRHPYNGAVAFSDNAITILNTSENMAAVVSPWDEVDLDDIDPDLPIIDDDDEEDDD
jgi:hypothetical protein